MNKTKPHSTFQEQFLVSLKPWLYIEDIMVLVNVGYSKAYNIKKEIMQEHKTLYPIPTEIVMNHLGLNEQRMERAAMKEKKLLGT